MNQKLQAAVHKRDEMTYVKLAGVIDEDNELAELAERIPAGTVAIDLSDIERINSCGVRDWVNWLGKIEKVGAKVVLVECSPAIVAQINLVNNFTGNGVVKSFFAPYFCPNCDREKVLLVEANEMGAPPHKAPVCRCDECDGVMDFDDMEDSYFAFLSAAKKAADIGPINKVMSELVSADGEKSKIRSRVGAGTTTSTLGGSSLPSVPSLPSIAKPTGSQVGFVGKGGGTGGGGSKPGGSTATPSRPGSSTASTPTVSGVTVPSPEPVASAPAAKSGKLVYVIVVALLLAIGVLVYMLFGGSKRESPDGQRSLPASTSFRA